MTDAVITAYLAWKAGGPFTDLEARLEDLATAESVTPPPKPLTTAQAARIAGISVRMVSKLCDAGDIVCWRICRDRRIEVESLRAWMERVGMPTRRLDVYLGRTKTCLNP